MNCTTTLSKIGRSAFRFLYSTRLVLVALLGFLAASISANASCVVSGKVLTGKLPVLTRVAHAMAFNPTDDDNSIVGLWYVQYSLPDGNPFNSSLDEWHSDGTEFENAALPPAVGNICFGAWKKIGPRTVKLHHIGWQFAPDGSLAGYFTLDEINTVSKDGGTYSGSFSFQEYQLNGTPVTVRAPNGPPPHVEGTILAKRITPDDTTLPN